MKTILSSLFLLATVVAVPACAADTNDDRAESSEDALTPSTLASRLKSFDNHALSSQQIGSLVAGTWNVKSGYRFDGDLSFSAPDSSGTMRMTGAISLPDVKVLIAAYGDNGARVSIHNDALFAQLKSMSAAQVIAAGGTAGTQYRLPITANVRISPDHSVSVQVTSPSNPPAAFLTAIASFRVDINTWDTFDRPFESCAQSHVTSGGVVCDVPGPIKIAKGTGLVNFAIHPADDYVSGAWTRPVSAF